jgi:hypothetical protein
MRLYPLNAPRTVIDHPVWGHFEADDHGGFDLPDEMSDELHSFSHRGKRIWETEDERSLRLHGEDLARRRDPAALYDAVDNFTGLLGKLAAVQVPAAAAVPDSRDAEIAELRRQLAEFQQPAAVPASVGEDSDGGTAEGGTGISDQAPAKPTGRSKGAAK